MAKRRRKEWTFKDQVFAALVAALLVFCAYHACWNHYADEFDPPNTVDLAFSRIGYGFQKLVGQVEGQIEETNDSMQNTVDGRHNLNDSRIERDTQEE